MRFRDLLIPLLTVTAICQAQGPPRRPAITGISHVAFYSSDLEASKKFYDGLLGLAIEPPGSNDYQVGLQSVELEPLPPGHGRDRIAHVAFATPDAEGIRKYLAANGYPVPTKANTDSKGMVWFALKDPEDNLIEFVQERPELTTRHAGKPVSNVMIHSGFVVHDRAAEDRLYRDLLGFRVYWHGGMKDNETDWVDMQVPDGTQWLEYMLVRPGEQPSPRTLGVLNHIALGVPSISAAAQLIGSRGWKPSDTEREQLGRDGKWQLNLYDPDGTRVELMEFTPVQTPCCSAYTGPHPH
ncbi:MAG TPA: VOC family protein [Candidatus Bathyarchaeia archaeon]|nr:VOC family protein [Candidatus Bathyarchaeia archaeon]